MQYLDLNCSRKICVERKWNLPCKSLSMLAVLYRGDWMKTKQRNTNPGYLNSCSYINHTFPGLVLPDLPCEVSCTQMAWLRRCGLRWRVSILKRDRLKCTEGYIMVVWPTYWAWCDQWALRLWKRMFHGFYILQVRSLAILAWPSRLGWRYS